MGFRVQTKNSCPVMKKTSLRYAYDSAYIKDMMAVGYTDPFDYAIGERKRICQIRGRQYERRRNIRHRKHDFRTANRRAKICRMYDMHVPAARLKKGFAGGHLHDDGSGYAKIEAENKSNSIRRFSIRDMRMFEATNLKLKEFAVTDEVA